MPGPPLESPPQGDGDHPQDDGQDQDSRARAFQNSTVSAMIGHPEDTIQRIRSGETRRAILESDLEGPKSTFQLSNFDLPFAFPDPETDE